MSSKRVMAILLAVVIGLGVATVGPAPARAAGTERADTWSEPVIDLLLSNKKVIARCIGNAVFIGYGALRVLRAAQLRDRIVDIISLAQGLLPASCVTTVEVAKAALRIWRIGGRDGNDFTVQDDSYVVDRPFSRNECYFDVTVGDESTGRTWRYRASYRFCSPDTYGG
jgi:hypothetical protein